MMAVELRGVHMMGCAYSYMVQVELLRVCTQFYYGTCRNYVVFVLFAHYYPHRTVIILRKTIYSNSLGGLRFLS